MGPTTSNERSGPRLHHAVAPGVTREGSSASARVQIVVAHKAQLYLLPEHRL